MAESRFSTWVDILGAGWEVDAEAEVCAVCGASCATADSRAGGVRSDGVPRCWLVAGLPTRPFSGSGRWLMAWNEVDATAGDILAAGVAARDAGLDPPFLDPGTAAWDDEETSSEAGCAMTI
jgi:hypothetical protein